ncbi:hypothetical protein [Myxosarcina sp. GI1(2024)]
MAIDLAPLTPNSGGGDSEVASDISAVRKRKYGNPLVKAQGNARGSI